ncbi:MAG TPA: hypothetical protein VFW07_13590 [Parafilimonas sp.]|nr:hypothetical protein [Parafilimonas sp.]
MDKEENIQEKVSATKDILGKENFPEDPHAPKPTTGHSQPATENMEVHHHSHTHEKRNWKSYFREFLMLFLAVFCGFLAEYQLEHIIEHQREKEFIVTMTADLEEDTAMFAKLIPSLESNIKRADTLIHLLNAPDVKSYGSDLYYLGRRASRSQSLSIHDRTIQQMKNSGGFRLIRNEKASKAIIDYYNQLGFINMLLTLDLNETNEYKKVAAEVFNPVIFDGILQTHSLIQRPSGNPSLLSYDKTLLARLSNMVSYMKSSRLSLIDAVTTMQDAAAQLIELLKKEYRIEE